MKFMLGCNYWSSHAGTEMWRNWDEKVVDNDLRILSENGVEYLRVFPLWRDFQPAMPLYDANRLYEYRMEGERYAEKFDYISDKAINVI